VSESVGIEERKAAAPAAAFHAPYAAVLAGLDAVSAWVLILLMAAMVVIVSAQVFARYVLNESIDSADELSRLLFVWSIFLAIPHGVKVGAHIGVDMLMTRLPEPVQDGVHRGVCLLGAVLMATVSYHAVRVANGSWDEPLATLNVPSALLFLSVALGAAHSVLHLVEHAWTGARPQAGTSE